MARRTTRTGSEALKFAGWGAALAAGILAARLASAISPLVERVYGEALFPRLVGAIAAPARAIGFSLAQAMLLAAVILLPWLAVVATRRAIRRRSFGAGFGPPHRIVALAAIGVWTFQLAWGLNHARAPLATRLGLAGAPSDAAALSKLTRRLAAEVNRTYAWAIESGQLRAAGAASGASTPPASALAIPEAALVDRLEAAYRTLFPRYAGVALPAPRHPSVIGRLLPALGISGFYFPFTGEANVAVGMPGPAPVYVAAHEMAHQRGIAREDEANFLAYLVCRESGNPVARYAGSLFAYGLASRALWRASPDSARALGHLLDEGPRADRAAIRAFWDRRKSRLEPVASHVNDRYLRASGHPAGIASYGQAIELLLAWEAAGGMEGE